MSITNDQRLFPRVQIALDLGYELVPGLCDDVFEAGKPVWITCTDVSVSGIGFRQDLALSHADHHKLETGQKKLRLKIRLPDGTLVQTFARMVWTRAEQGRYGFSFIDMPQISYYQLGQFLHGLLQNSA